MSSKFTVFKYKSNKLNDFEDHISIEEPLEIILKYKDKNESWIEKTISITMRTPGDDEDLVRGFLFNEKVIDKLDYIEKIETVGETSEQYGLQNKIIVKINNSENIDIDLVGQGPSYAYRSKRKNLGYGCLGLVSKCQSLPKHEGNRSLSGCSYAQESCFT